MKQIFEGDALIKLVAGAKGVSQDKTYKWSVYVFPFSHKGETYLFNTLTKKGYALDGDEINIALDARFSSATIESSESLTALVADFFLVPEDKDEVAFYENFVRIARMMRSREEGKGYTSYTILPTTACNARCIYCFEQGIKYITMTNDIVEQTIRFILKTHNPQKRVKLSWFGGEPLIGEKTIDRICAALREAGVDFYSSMVSNGSLITEKIIEKMSNEWNLRHIQITLDGVEEEYNRRKNYYFNYDSAYWHILSRLKLLNEQPNIYISVRINVDAGNIDGVNEMLGEVDAFLPHKERVGISVSPLYGIRKDGKDLEVLEKSLKLYDDITAAGYYLSLKYPLRQARIRYCMADSPHKNVVIAPDGKIYNCENIQTFPALGDIWDGVTNKDLYQSLMQVEKVSDKCKGCVSLPDCTSFSRCSHIVMNCQKFMEHKMLRTLKQQIDNKTIDESEDLEQDC